MIDRDVCYDDAGHFLVTVIDCNIAWVAGARRGDWGERGMEGEFTMRKGVIG